MDQRLRRRNRLGIVIAGAALSGCRPGFQATVDWDDGTSLTVGTKFDERIGLGPAQSPNLGVNSSGLAFCSANYTALAGRQLAFNIVGTDPSLGANTTTVPTALVPLKFVFPNPSNSTLDGTNVVPVTQNWPIFLTADYTTGSADISVPDTEMRSNELSSGTSRASRRTTACFWERRPSRRQLQLTFRPVAVTRFG